MQTLIKPYSWPYRDGLAYTAARNRAFDAYEWG
jgi:hypothetical protein